MNREEKITENYLKSLDYRDVVFEPDGNISPDFSIDDRIAAEVRRLNQHFFTEDGKIGTTPIIIDRIESLDVNL